MEQNKGYQEQHSQENKLELMMHQLLDSLNKHAQEMERKMDNRYIELNQKFKSLTSRLESLDKRVFKISSFSKPKEYVNTIIIISEKNLEMELITDWYGLTTDRYPPMHNTSCYDPMTD